LRPADGAASRAALRCGPPASVVPRGPARPGPHAGGCRCHTDPV